MLDGAARDVDDVAAADGDGEGLRLEALSLAVLTLALGHVPLDLGADHVGLGLAVPAFQVVDDALERGVPPVHASALGPVLDTDSALAGAVEEDVELVLGEAVEGFACGEAVLFGDGCQEAHHPGVGGAGAHPRLDCALDEAQVLVRHDEIGVDLQLVAQPGASLARAVRVVEAERAGLHFAEADVAVDAGELLRKEQVVAVDDVDEHRSAGELEGGLDGVGHAGLFEAVSNDQTVDDDLDVVPLGLLERDVLGEVARLAVDADADEPSPPGVLEDLFVLALATPHHGGENLDSGAVGKVDDGVDHLLDGLALDGTTAGMAVRVTDAGEEEAQVVVDLGDGAYGGARVA